MCDLIKLVSQATADEMSDLSFAVKKRYDELFPDWEIIMITLEKSRDRDEQIDNMILMLEGMRKLSVRRNGNGKCRL